jgi:hypothetical protein
MRRVGGDWTKGQLTMALAAELHRKGIDAGISMDAAMAIIDEGRTTTKWRQKLGDAWADAIDADLADIGCEISGRVVES